LLGYIPDFATAARYLLVLVLLVIVIANKGAFQNLQTALTSSPQSVNVPTEASLSGTPTIDVALTGGSGALTSPNNPISSVATGANALGKTIGGFLGLF
jgi:hypothetical protein